MQKTRSIKVTRLAMIAALVFLGILIDSIVTYGLAVKIAVATIVVVITIAILCSFGEAVFAGFVFGVLSMLRALIMPSIIQAMAINNFWLSFANPIVSVLPRILIGLNVWAAFRVLKGMFGKAKAPFVSKTLPCSLSALVGVVTNTGFVMLAMLVMKYASGSQLALWDFILTYFSINFLIELAVSVCIVPFLASGLVKTKYFKPTEKKKEHKTANWNGLKILTVVGLILTIIGMIVFLITVASGFPILR